MNESHSKYPSVWSTGTDSRNHIGSTIPDLGIIGNIMANPLIPHKRIGERKLWAKYIQIAQKKENLIPQI